MLHDFTKAGAKHLTLNQYLDLAQQLWPSELAEPYMARMAETGFLLVPVGTDAVAHGDALFRQERVVGVPLGAAEHWERHGRLHNELCEHGLKHLPVRLGLADGKAVALAWLVPAVSHGRATVPGLDEEWVLDAAARRRWLLVWAARLSELVGVPRLVVQLPGIGPPAYWFYRRYLGDLALPGTPLERVRLLLGGLARYEFGQALATADGEDGSLLLNVSPSSWEAGQMRADAHCELLPMGGN